MRRPAFLSFPPILITIMLAGAGCSDSTGPAEQRVPASIQISPAAPSVDDGLTIQLAGSVRDQNGQPVSPAPAVSWTSSDESVATVTASGLVTGERPGTATITATSGSANGQTVVTVNQVATTVASAGGDGQAAEVGTQLGEAIRVRVTDRHGEGVSGAQVDFVVTGGGGAIQPSSVSTDASGYASASWTLGGSTGEQTAEARRQGLAGSPVLFTATAQAPTEEYEEGSGVVGGRSIRFHNGAYYQVLHDNRGGAYGVYLRTSANGVTWSDKIPVSDGPAGTDQYSAAIAVWSEGGSTRVAVSFADFRTTNPQLRVAVSADGGQSFGPSVSVSNHNNSVHVLGSIAVDEAGVLYVAWTRDAGSFWNETWFSRSTDGGATWSAQSVVFQNGRPWNSDTHIEAGASGQVWIVTSADEGSRTNLILNRTTNGGTSWSQSHLTSYAVGFQTLQPSLLRGTDGSLYVIWQDRQGAGVPQRVRIMRSTDSGASWGTPVQVSDDVVLGLGEYNFRARPHLAQGADGTLYAVWADERAQHTGALDARNYDVYLSRSTDNGATWSTDERVNDMPEVLEQRRPSVAAGTGGALVVWEDRRLSNQRMLHRLMP